MQAKRISTAYKRALLTYLDRFLADATIEKPLDIHKLFVETSSGQSNNLGKALSQFLNYLELDGLDKAFLDSLRKAIPAQNKGVDNDVPSEALVKESLTRLYELLPKHQVIYNLILDSGLRVTEAVRVLAEFKHEKAVALNGGFYRVGTYWMRGKKNSFACYFTEPVYEELWAYEGSVVGADDFSRNVCKHGLVAPKYLRKFVFDAMISEELAIPESVADFVEGRTAQKVGARHHTKLVKQADGWYGRYACYVSKLRNAAPPTRSSFCRHCGGTLKASDPAPFCRSCALPKVQA